MTRIVPIQSRRLAAAAFLVAGSARNPAVDINPQPESASRSTPVQVAAVDITQSFRRHPGVMRGLDEIKHCRTLLAGRIAAARRELCEAERRLAALTPGSEAHRLVATRIARRKNQLREKAERAKGELRQQEARIYDATYDVLVAMIVQHARCKNVPLAALQN